MRASQQGNDLSNTLDAIDDTEKLSVRKSQTLFEQIEGLLEPINYNGMLEHHTFHLLTEMNNQLTGRTSNQQTVDIQVEQQLLDSSRSNKALLETQNENTCRQIAQLKTQIMKRVAAQRSLEQQYQQLWSNMLEAKTSSTKIGKSSHLLIDGLVEECSGKKVIKQPFQQLINHYIRRIESNYQHIQTNAESARRIMDRKIQAAQQLEQITQQEQQLEKITKDTHRIEGMIGQLKSQIGQYINQYQQDVEQQTLIRLRNVLDRNRPVKGQVDRAYGLLLSLVSRNVNESEIEQVQKLIEDN